MNDDDRLNYRLNWFTHNDFEKRCMYCFYWVSNAKFYLMFISKQHMWNKKNETDWEKIDEEFYFTKYNKVEIKVMLNWYVRNLNLRQLATDVNWWLDAVKPLNSIFYLIYKHINIRIKELQKISIQHMLELNFDVCDKYLNF